MSDVVRNYPELTKNFDVREWKFLTDLSDLIDSCTDCPVLHPNRCIVEKSKCHRFRYKLVTDLAEKYGYKYAIKKIRDEKVDKEVTG